MTDTKPNMLPGSKSQSRASAGQDNAPDQLPPASSAAAAASDCGCNKSSAGDAATLAPPHAAMTSGAAPSMQPASAGAGGVTAAWRTNAKIIGMWGINQNRNSWAYLENIGWKKLAGDSDSAIVDMTMVAAHAYQTGAAANCYEEDDGRISQMYVW